MISARDGIPVLGQRFQHLRRPDHRDVRGLADPEDLFLHLGQAFEAAFDGQVAARDHHPAARRPHRRQQHLRQVLEAAPRLDLQHDGGSPIAQARADAAEATPRPAPCWRTRARRRRRAAATNARSSRSLAVSAASRRSLSGRLMPLSARSFSPRRRRLGDSNDEPGRLSTFSTTPPILPSSNQIDSPGADVVEHLRNRAADHRGRQHSARRCRRSPGDPARGRGSG